MALFGRLRPIGTYMSRKCAFNIEQYVKSDVLSVESSRYFFQGRYMSSASSVKNIDINELQKFQKNADATIIDVREPDEIRETGVLPGSTNIPLGTVAAALQEDPSKFKEKFGIPKPPKDNPVVFSCRSGRRSMMAAETAVSQGYQKVYNYAGGILDWLEHFPKQ